MEEYIKWNKIKQLFCFFFVFWCKIQAHLLLCVMALFISKLACFQNETATYSFYFRNIWFHHFVHQEYVTNEMCNFYISIIMTQNFITPLTDSVNIIARPTHGTVIALRVNLRIIPIDEGNIWAYVTTPSCCSHLCHITLQWSIRPVEKYLLSPTNDLFTVTNSFSSVYIWILDGHDSTFAKCIEK